MSTFRKYGGVKHSATNNVTRSAISNIEQLNINASSGQANSKETFNSHIDMIGNGLLNVGSVYFQDGTHVATANGLKGPQGDKGRIGRRGDVGPKWCKVNPQECNCPKS